jgi:hypothetical protein
MTGQTFCAAKTSGSPAPAEWAMKAAVAAFDQPLPTDSIMLSVARAIEAAANAATERERERCAAIAESRSPLWEEAIAIASAIRKGGDNDV